MINKDHIYLVKMREAKSGYHYIIYVRAVSKPHAKELVEDYVVECYGDTFKLKKITKLPDDMSRLFIIAALLL